jgi:hypothetical protein
MLISVVGIIGLTDSNLTTLRAFWNRIEEENKEMCR